MPRYSYATGERIPDAVAAAMDELDAAHDAVARAAYYADRDVEGAYADLAEARDWRDRAQEALEAAWAAEDERSAATRRFREAPA